MKKFIFLVYLTFIIIFLFNFEVDASIGVLDGLTKEYTVRKGQELDDVITLFNSTNQVVNVRIYQKDYLFYADGRKLYKEVDIVDRSNNKWIQIPDLVTIPPESEIPVNLSLLIPDDNTLNGTYWSIIMVEPLEMDDVDEDISNDGDVNLGVNTVVRYGIQIVTHIGNTGERSIKILEKRILNENGKSILTLDIENDGQRWVKPEVSIDLYNSDGELSAELSSGVIKRLFPGTSVRHSIDLGSVSGKYQAMVIIDNGDDNIWGAQYKLDL
ncbi:MAG: hypothetical protein ACOCRO_04305 [Halanaerobiales bacterium]